MPTSIKTALQPRKMPVQARSTASVDAILQATIQVLVAVGKERLTTTLVAQRAGVSVGTLYQYFPNKSSLLQACLRVHMERVRTVVEQTCTTQTGAGLLAMATALIDSYMSMKMRDVRESVSLYAVSSDIEGIAIAKATNAKVMRSMAKMFATAKEGLTKEPEMVAAVVGAAMNGISRRVLESKHPEREVVALREELLVLVHSYLRTCAAKPLD